MLWLVPLTPILGALAVLASGTRSRGALAIAGGAVAAATLALAVAAAAAGWSAALAWSPAVALEAELTPLSRAVAVTLPAVALPVLVYAAMHEARSALDRLIALLLVFVGAMELLVIAADLLTLLIGWELVGACSWALIGHDWRDRAAPASATHAFLLTRFGDLGMFVAAAAAFAGAGSFAYADLGELDGPLLHVVVFGLVLAASAKSAQLPFSIWLFRAMVGPTSVSALLHAAAMVAAGAFALARLQPELARADAFGPAVVAIGAATALSGGIVAVLQDHAKKLLAASTSAHYGLMFVATGAGFPAVAVAHLVTHAFFKALMFLASGVAGEAAGGFGLRRMGMGRALPLTAGMTLLGTLALAGVPPLGGAWSKEAVVTAAADASAWAALAVIGAGALSACYAFRFQWLAFGTRDGSEAQREHAGEEPSRAVLAALGVLATATAAASLLWLPPVETAAASLLGARFPHPSAAELIASLAAVGVGVYAARLLTVSPAPSRPATHLAEWLGLPDMLDAAVTRPAARLTVAMARFDGRVPDRVPAAFARRVRRTSITLAGADGAVVDRGVRAAAALIDRLARVGARAVEAAADAGPEGTASMLGMAGMDARRLQSGLSHRYYSIIAVGAVLTVAILAAAT